MDLWGQGRLDYSTIGISTASVLPFAAAALSAYLAYRTLAGGRMGNRTTLFFVLLNFGIMVWSLFYAIELNMVRGPVVDIAPIGSVEYLVYALQIIGLAAAPTYWFLFAASYSRRYSWVYGWRMWMVHVPMAYTIIVALTNPLHQLFIAHSGLGQPVTYGPFAIPHQIGTFVLVAVGTFWVVQRVARPGVDTTTRQAIVLGATAMLPFLGGLAWALRHPLGLPLVVNPLPALFAVLDTVILHQVVNRGFADVVPTAAMQAFHAMSDAMIVVDESGVVMAVNPAAELVLPHIQTGVLLGDISPEMAQYAEGFIISQHGYAEFRLSTPAGNYWGRFRQTLNNRGQQVGFVVLLTDITELGRLPDNLGVLDEWIERLPLGV